MLARSQEVQPDHVSRSRLVSLSEVGYLKHNVRLGSPRLPEDPGYHIRQPPVHEVLHSAQGTTVYGMCLSKASSWSECSPQPGHTSSTDRAKAPRALDPEILLSVTLTDSADALWTQDEKVLLMQKELKQQKVL